MRTFLVAAIAGGCLFAVSGLVSADAPKPSAPATIHVTLPSNATLFINGEKTKSTSAERWFVTPALDSDKAYACLLKAEYVRDGMTVTVERRLTLRAGRESQVSLDAPGRDDAYTSFYGGSASAPVPTVVRVIPRAVDWPTTWTGN